ncbi:hypothetical protein RND71_000896 [Anisodus tanguticus]|uniref:Adhesive plaque matrix protein-like n=1 Tax=Anisodus tanguticus TaxID=243964 RepID=A0AAE1SY71_9SOLA|nr:hypothetical protein RND71_000896 [Anisodus tanguticus]
MAGYGKGGGSNTYKEVHTYQDDWGKPITTVSDYPNHVRPVIVDVQGSRSPIVSYSTEHGVEGYVVRAQRIVEVRRSYDIPLNGLLDEYNVHEEWDDHSPRKVHDFFDKVHNEASRPTHPTLLSSPKWSTNKPSRRSEDHDSPKYSNHRDLSDNDWEKSSGSPLRDRFEGLHLQDNRGSSPYKYKKDGYEKPSFTHSVGSPKAGHFKDYGVNKTWDSPPRSRSTHEDWDSRRGDDDYVKSPYSKNQDDYGKPKFNGGYKRTSPPLSQATNHIGTAMKILEQGNKPLASPTYAPQSHFPASYSTPHIKEGYPERTQGGKTLASPVSTQPSYYPTSNPITERKESYPEPTKGMKPLVSPVYTQQPHSPTSNPTPQRKESYPKTAHAPKPFFSPVHTQQPHSPTSYLTPQRKESYPETMHGAKPLFSPAYTQQPHSPTSNRTPQRKESYPETTHGPIPLFSPVYTSQSHSPTSNPTPLRKESYPETAHSAKPLFSPAYTPQPHSPTSNQTSQRKESYPETEHDVNPHFPPGSTQQPHFLTAYPTSQNNESYPKKTKGWKSLFSPAAKQQPHSPPTSHSTPEMKQNYPDHEMGGRKPSLSPSSPQKEHYSPQMEDHYPDKIQGWKPFPSPYENTQEPRYGAIIPPKEAMDSSEARKRYANLKPMSPAQMKYSGTIDSREAVEKYNGAFVP